MSFRRGKSIIITGGLCIVLFAGAGLKPVQARGHAVWRITENHYFRAISDAPDTEVRKLLLGLERFRVIVQKFATVTIPHDAPPVEVVIFDKVNEFREYTPSNNVAGFMTHGDNGHLFIVMPVVYLYADAMHDIRHEYVHALLAYHPFPLPHWYEEGLAEFLASVEIRGDEIIVGKPPENRLKYWYNESLFSFNKIVADKVDPVKTSFADAYMQYWLLTDYMIVDAKRSKDLNTYIALYDSGMDSLKAFKISFGKTPDEMAKYKLSSYTHHIKIYRMKFDFTGMDTNFRTGPAPGQEVKDMHNFLAHLNWSK